MDLKELLGRQEETTEEEGGSTWSPMAPQREPKTYEKWSARGWNAAQGLTEEAKLRGSQPSRFQGLRSLSCGELGLLCPKLDPSPF